MGLILTPEFIARERDWLRATRDRVLANLSVEGFLAQMAATMSHDATAELGRIGAPTLILKPAADALIPPRASDELQRLIPGATPADIRARARTASTSSRPTSSTAPRSTSFRSMRSTTWRAFSALLAHLADARQRLQAGDVGERLGVLLAARLRRVDAGA